MQPRCRSGRPSCPNKFGLELMKQLAHHSPYVCGTGPSLISEVVPHNVSMQVWPSWNRACGLGSVLWLAQRPGDLDAAP